MSAETIFSDINKLTSMVASGSRNSLIVCGDAGVGKSKTVMTALEQCGLREGRDYIVIKGKSTVLGLYESLYRNSGKILVYDDCDSILRNNDSVNILKGALDSGDERMISWNSRFTFDTNTTFTLEERKLLAKGKLPNKFEFEGRVIFITNLPKDKLDNALKSRSFVIDVCLTTTEVLNRIETIIEKLVADDPKVTIQMKKQVLQFFRDVQYCAESDGEKYQVSIRTYIAGVMFRVAYPTDWRRMILEYA